MDVKDMAKTEKGSEIVQLSLHVATWMINPCAVTMSSLPCKSCIGVRKLTERDYAIFPYRLKLFKILSLIEHNIKSGRPPAELIRDFRGGRSLMTIWEQ